MTDKKLILINRIEYIFDYLVDGYFKKKIGGKYLLEGLLIFEFIKMYLRMKKYHNNSNQIFISETNETKEMDDNTKEKMEKIRDLFNGF